MLAADCLLALREKEPEDEHELEEWQTRAGAGALLIADGLHDLFILRKALTRDG